MIVYRVASPVAVIGLLGAASVAGVVLIGIDSIVNRRIAGSSPRHRVPGSSFRHCGKFYSNFEPGDGESVVVNLEEINTIKERLLLQKMDREACCEGRTR